MTSAPACLARTFMPAPPLRKFNTICLVTSFGKAETPSSATPWSPAKVNITFLSITGIVFSVIATSLLANSSSLPRLPNGFVRLSSLFCASSLNFPFIDAIRNPVSEIINPPFAYLVELFIFTGIPATTI